MHKIDSAHKYLDRVAKTYGQLDLASANEAQTRFHLIDEVLLSVLGWEKTDIEVEDRASEDGATTYADYIIRTAATTLVVEAKRLGAAFTLPTNRKLLRLGGVLQEGAIGAAIRQARDYCRERAIPFAVVTNGNAWIIFAAVRTDGVSFEESTAHIFRDIADVKERFVEFWEFLSKERVLDGNISNVLLGRQNQDVPQRNIRQLLTEPSYRLGRNALYEHIEPAVSISLSDEGILESPEALAACYVKTGERIKFDSRLKIYFHDSMPPIGHKTVRVLSRKNTKKFEKELTSTRIDSRRFIVVLGPVGAGKTTFLHYTRKVSATDSIDGKVLWLLIDFKKATSADSPRQFILKELISQIDEDNEFNLGDWHKSVKPAYEGLIQNLRRGALYLLAESDPKAFDAEIANRIMQERDQLEPYVERILRHAGSQRPIFLVIDNVDQLDDLDFQGKVFVEAQAIARRIETNVIMAMRESTFLKHRSKPVFDAFQFDSFYIDPPSALPVLSHRFAYAKRILTGRSVRLTTENGITISIDDLGSFFEVVTRSLLREQTGYMIDALSANSVRRGLEVVRTFLSSGHTNADRAISSYIREGDYRFPEHEIFKAVVLGQMKYFSDSSSLLPNIYDSKLGAPEIQFLRLRILTRLVEMSADPAFKGETVAELLGDLGRIGVSQIDFMNTLNKLANSSMIRTADGLDVNLESTVLPTRLGAFTIKTLCLEFAYNEFCSIDAIVFDDESWNQVKEDTYEVESLRHPYERLMLRVRRLRRFLSSWEHAEERWIVECKRRSLGLEWQTRIVHDEIIPGVERSIEVALRSAQKNYPLTKETSALGHNL